METYCDSRFRTGTLGTTYSRLTWSTSSDPIRIMALAPTCSINRYYDPTTDSFISVDPDLQLTNQAYVFVDDNPLNSVDPLGLKNKKILKTKSEVVFYSVPVGINGEVKIKNVINALYVATPYSKTLVSLSFGNKTASYGTGISSDYPVEIKPTLYIIETLGGHKVKVGTVTFNVSVCCGDSTSPEYDPGTEEIISPEPAVGLTSYQNSVTFAVAYTTPAH